MAPWLQILSIVACAFGTFEPQSPAYAATDRLEAAAFRSAPIAVAAVHCDDLLELDEEDDDPTNDGCLHESAYVVVATIDAGPGSGRRDTLVRRAYSVGWSPRGPPAT